ncbi:hypothetical protein HPB47_028167 [Ixodes persulcatus]|uniref:Uncharacterized protein n=1 Tax=Ixodes persulcatus TaxID=34615 RepID=A0AC60PUI5_IXOPE|nr:hypothetical protein HPB47_028167 [Ixodes persulcatus]
MGREVERPLRNSRAADGVVRIDGRFNAEAYCDIIENTLVPYVLDGSFPDVCFFLQQDRSPVHEARRVSAMLEASGIHQLEWPPNGADCNPIENIWGTMKKNLVKRHLSRASADSLFEAVNEEWNALRARPELVARLYESMPRRLQQVIAVEGNFTAH